MKKYLLTLVAVILFSITVRSQMGINTGTPKTTLDVSGATASSVADGLLVPRFTATTLEGKDNAYGLEQNGTLVFVTSGTGNTAKTIDVTEPGFYYYDHPNSKWVGIRVSSEEVLNITPEQTGSYTVTANDDYIKLNTTTPGNVLTLPTTGIDVGKIIYVSNIGSDGIDIVPTPRLPTQTQVQSKVSGALMYIGGTGNGSWDWILGY